MTTSLEIPTAPPRASADSGFHVVRTSIDYTAKADKTYAVSDEQELPVTEETKILTRKDEPVTPETWNADVDKWTVRIKPKWERVLASSAAFRPSIFELGEELDEAKKHLPYEAYKAVLFKSGIWSLSNADNYIRVAKAEHLRKPEYQRHFPMGRGALIDLAAWEEKNIKYCIDCGVMHPDISRKELAKWRMGEPKKKAPSDPPKRPVLVVKPKGDWSNDDQAALEAAMAPFKDRVEYERPQTPEKMDVERKVLNRVGKAVKALLDEAKERDKVFKTLVKTKDPFGNAELLYGSPEITVNDNLMGLKVPASPNEQFLRIVLRQMGQEDRYEQLYEEAVTYWSKAQMPTDKQIAAEIEMINKSGQTLNLRSVKKERAGC